jgi:outer membrane lipoprotein carrier protein
MKAWMIAALSAALGTARADAVDTLREFAREVKSGKADFAQTVTSPDGKKTRTSSGSFEFSRPDRFRFVYAKPFEQLIVGDGRKVWIHDPDLNQVTSRTMGAALGSTPAALLAGTSLEQDFVLSALPERDGLAWAQAVPKVRDGSFQTVKVGFRGKELAAIDITDSFGQRSLMTFSNVAANVPISPDTFRFVPPKGADVIEQ